MSHRFTDRARKVIVRAREEARHMNSASVDTEHLLLAVIRENERIAYQVTEHMGVSFSLVLSEIERKLHRKLLVRGESIPGGPDLSPRSKRVLALAADEARNVDLTYIGTEQLLRALMREKSGSAANVLRKLGLDIEIFLQLMIQSLVPEMPVGISRERSRLRSAPKPDLAKSFDSLRQFIDSRIDSTFPMEKRYRLTHLLHELDRLNEWVCGSLFPRLAMDFLNGVNWYKEHAVELDEYETAAHLRDALAELTKVLKEIGEIIEPEPDES